MTIEKNETCQVCGQAVAIHTAREGTGSYIPKEAERERAEILKTMEATLADEWSSDYSFGLQMAVRLIKERGERGGQ